MWGRVRSYKQCTQRFVEALNAHDVDAMAGLMSEDFCYIDSWREGIEGRDKILAGLKILFESDPDFGIAVDSMTYKSPDILMSGRVTSARFGDRRSVWRIVCDGEQLSEWQSWADGGPQPMTRALSPSQARDLSHRASDRPDLDDT